MVHEVIQHNVFKTENASKFKPRFETPDLIADLPFYSKSQILRFLELEAQDLISFIFLM